MKYIIFVLIFVSTIAHSDGIKRWYKNSDQQLEIQNSVYDLASKYNSKSCPIHVKVVTDFDFPVTSRSVYAEVFIKNIRLEYNELGIDNWSKFKYNFTNVVINNCGALK